MSIYNIEENIRINFFLILLTILSFSGLIIFMNIRKQKRQKNISESNINEALKEIKELGKKNSPTFYLRFIEVYTNFDELLSTKYPQLSIFEKTFLAMISLNFSNKEISDIESVSLKTIEIRKYRIRKKCNLESGKDLKKWLDELSLFKNR